LKSDFKQALNCYNQELQLNPNHRQALLNRAAVFFNLGNRAEAKTDLLKLQKLDPTNEQIFALLKQLN
jgi:tetratricopeptide (TPR) repeat protein